jgi:cytochrome d ubiquinol oxidase subunit II
MTMEWYLPLIWAGIIGTAVVLYVILDGFDLGIGMLFPLAEDDAERDQMMASIAPFWDGNETWLVMGGVGLLVAFPPAYAVVMPALYLPVIVMLLALVFRGVAFEFREIGANKALWNTAFAGGSTLAGFAQGVILGGLIQGIAVKDGAYAGGTFDWATPFALLCGFGVSFGYALLGATWLVMKTKGPVAERARTHAVWLLYAVLGFMAAVSLWTPLAFPRIAERWFSLPNFFFLWPVPLLTALAAFAAWHSLRRGGDFVPFLATIGLFLLGFAGLVISSFPYLVPPSLTVWQTAAAPASQTFMLAGTVVLLPLILAYTAYVYWLFRGKVGPGESYH